MRYAWDQFEVYFGVERIGPIANALARPVFHQLARWDAGTAGRVDRYVAISNYVAGRIQRYYNRPAAVVYPPVDTVFFHPATTEASPAALIVSALVPYKRIDLAIEACRLASIPLRIIGVGPEMERLRKLAGPEVKFFGSLNDEAVREEYRQAKVFLLPGEEEFGIAPLEAQACGCPVIALNRGGAQETVINEVTGILVDECAPAAFASALCSDRISHLDKSAIRTHALRFSEEHFLSNISEAVSEMIVPLEGEARW